MYTVYQIIIIPDLVLLLLLEDTDSVRVLSPVEWLQTPPPEGAESTPVCMCGGSV